MLMKVNKITKSVILILAIGVIIATTLISVNYLPKKKINFITDFAERNYQELSGAISNTFNDIVVTHVETPESVRAIYLSSWAAGNEKYRKMLFDIVANTEINAVVIDVKDYSGKISFPVNDPYLVEIGSSENRIPDIKNLIDQLHKRNVYVIGRISSFQDSYLINVFPESAVKNKSGGIWKDFKGVKWLDAGSEQVWKYLIAIGKESYSVGFDELNFDYIRFPSDGNMQDIVYPWSKDRPRREVMRSFFSHLKEEFATSSIPISVDFFGLTTSADGDLGIGQNLNDALKYFDYVAPMVYPSHFAKGFIGIPKPAEKPYEVIKYSMDQALLRASTTVDAQNKIRPWLQAFDLGAIYTPAMVKAQIKASYDAGIKSWMLWNAGSWYDKNALESKTPDFSSLNNSRN